MPKDLSVCVKCWKHSLIQHLLPMESWPFGEGMELFDNGLKYLYKLIKNHAETKNFESNIFVIGKVLLKYCTSKIWSHVVCINLQAKR